MEIRIRNAAGVMMIVTTYASVAQAADVASEVKGGDTGIASAASSPGNTPQGHVPPDPYTIVGVAIVAFAVGFAAGRASGGKGKTPGNG
jgi:hypothetical protein